MIGRIAGNEFVEQCRRDIRVQPGHEAGSGADEVGVDVLKAGTIPPEGIFRLGLPGIMDVAERQAMIVGDVVVNADQFFPPGFRKRNGLYNRREPIVGQTGSGFRDKRQQSLPHRIDRRCVAREGCKSCRPTRGRRAIRKISTSKRCSCSRTDSRAKIAKVAVALGIRGDVHSAGRVGVLFAAPFLRPKEKGLLLICIVMVGNENRSADGVAEIMLFVRGFGLGGIGTLFPRARIKKVIAEIFEGAAVEGGPAGLCLHFDGTGAVAAVLSAVVRGENFEFGNGFRVGVDVEGGVAAVIHVVAAVELPVVVLRAAAIHAVGDVAVHADFGVVLTGLAHHAGG